MAWNGKFVHISKQTSIVLLEYSDNHLIFPWMLPSTGPVSGIARTPRSRRSVFIPLRWLGQGGTHEAECVFHLSPITELGWTNGSPAARGSCFYPTMFIKWFCEQILMEYAANPTSRPQWEKQDFSHTPFSHSKCHHCGIISKLCLLVVIIRLHWYILISQ